MGLNLLYHVLSFLAGGVTAVAILSIMGYRQYKKRKKERDEAFEKIKKFVEGDEADKFMEEVEKTSKEVKALTKKLDDLLDEQAQITSNLEAPSAGASHAHYQNSLIHSLKEIEVEKIETMEKILEYGIDFDAKVKNEDGKVVIMKLSEVLETIKENNLENNDLYQEKMGVIDKEDNEKQMQEEIKEYLDSLKEQMKGEKKSKKKEKIEHKNGFTVIDGGIDDFDSDDDKGGNC